MEHMRAATLQVRCGKLAGKRFALRTAHVVRRVSALDNESFRIHCRRGWSPVYAGWEGSGLRQASVGPSSAYYLFSAYSDAVLDVLCLRRRVEGN